MNIAPILLLWCRTSLSKRYSYLQANRQAKRKSSLNELFNHTKQQFNH
jgi:hypothetical protein